MARRQRGGDAATVDATSKATAGVIEGVGRLDSLLSGALGPVPVPPSVWPGIRPGLSSGARRADRVGLEVPVPAFVAATAFCALFQTYRLCRVAESAWVQGVVSDFARLAATWVGLAVTFISGGG